MPGAGMVERQLARHQSARVQVLDGASARVRAQVAQRRRGWQLRVTLEDASGQRGHLGDLHRAEPRRARGGPVAG
ncbi:MAG: hypothetical protein R3B82_24995 [Sandaracinaceae bacterium]